MELLEQAVQELSSRCDGAGTEDGQGFNKVDSRFGRSMAARPYEKWSPKQQRAIWRMLQKYRNQLAGYGITYADIPEPPEPDAKPGRPALKYMAIKAGNILVQFDYRPDIVAAMKDFPKQNRRYQPDTKTWLIIPAPHIIDDVVDFASRYDFEVEQTVYDLLSNLVENQKELLNRSKAASSDFAIDGLGGTPYPFQRAGVEYALQAERTFIADQMGLGKTIQALAVIHVKKSFPALIVCPASVKYSWAQHALLWLPGRTVAMVKGKDFYRVLPSNGGRVYLEKDDHNLPGAYDLVIVNYDVLKPRPKRWRCTEGFTNAKDHVYDHGDFIMEKLKGFTKDELDLVKRHFERDGFGKSRNGIIEKFLNINLKALILDESHYAKQHRSQRTLGCTQISKGVPVRLLLSGTPILNRPSELISQLTILDRLNDLGGFWGFAERYCNAHQTRFGLDLSGAQNLGELNHIMRGLCYIRRTKDQVLTELPPKQRSDILVELDNKDEYKEAEADLIAWLKENARVQSEFMASIQYLNEAEQAEKISEYRMTASARAARALQLTRIEHLKQMAAKGKMAEAIEWIGEFLDTGEKLVVFASHIDVQKGLLAAFNGAAHILGEDSTSVRQENIERFQDDDKCRLVICSLKAAGIGITLTAASDVLFIELGWTPADHDQAEDRCHRIGQDGNVMAWYLLARESIDIDIQELIAEKREVVDAATDGESDAGQQTSIINDLIGRLIK